MKHDRYTWCSDLVVAGNLVAGTISAIAAIRDERASIVSEEDEGCHKKIQK